MATGGLARVIQQIRSAVILQNDGGPISDGQLLESFLIHGEDAAFTALVTRHGSMVLRVCRRILENAHDVEDAFQATFLVLARKARTLLPREDVGNWLYGVACNTALKCRGQIARQRRGERQAWTRGRLATPANETWNDLLPFLDAELARLPGKYRECLVLCDLEGKTRKEAALRLGLPEGTVASRQARGRMLLAKRLLRHKVAVSGGTLAGILARDAVASGVSHAFVASVAQSARFFATGNTANAGMISTRAILLAEGVLKAMLMSKVEIITVVLLGLGIVGVGSGVFRADARVEARGPVSSKLMRQQQSKAGATGKDQVQPPAKELSDADRRKVADLLQEAARVIQESGFGNQTMAEIAVVQSQIGEKVASKESFEKAKALLTQSYGSNPTEHQRSLAVALARAGYVSEVLELTATLPKVLEHYKEIGGFRDVVLSESATQLATGLRIKEALQIADLVEAPKYKSFAVARVRRTYVIALAQAGRLRDAAEAVKTIEDPMQIVLVLAGDLYNNFWFRDYPQGPGLALLQARASEPKQAEMSLDQVRSLLPRIPEPDRPRAIAALACAHAQMGNLDAASRLLNDVPAPPWRSFALAAYIKALAVAGKTKDAETMLASLEKGELVHALYFYATGQYQAGDVIGAKRSFAKAHAALTGLGEDVGHRYNLISAQALAGDADGAIAALEPSGRDMVTNNIVFALAKNGDFKSALQVAGRWPNDCILERAACLRIIAKAQSANGKVDEALVWIKLVQLPYERANGLLGAAEGLAERKG